jgi:hypothetical protein
MSNNDDCGAVQYFPQWQERLGWRLFPSNHIDSPEMQNARDVFVCKTVANLSFIDRLRVLISGKILVTTKTTTENVIGENITASGVTVLPPPYLDRK